MRRNLLTRATALVLSWVMPATTAWAFAPVVPPPPIMKGVAAPEAFALPSAWGSEPPAGGRVPQAASRALAATSTAIPAVETAWSDDDHHGSDHHHHHQGCDHDHDSHDNNHYDDDDDPPDSCHRALRPILECVVANGGSSYTAHFGYSSDSPAAVTVPVGTKNKFTPSPSGRGQPTVFQPGRTSAYPHAAFSVPFNGSNLVWTLQGPDHQVRTATASSSSQRCTAPSPPPPPPTPCAVSLFGPQKYTRTTGSPNVFTATVTVPSWANAPFTLKVVNGAANGSNRVSSATIKVNNVEVAGPSDFNQNVAGFERTVTLTPQTTLKVTLSSSPGSYLTLSLCSGKGDATRPVVTWVAPSEGSTVGTATPSLLVRYQDLVGANEPAASGIDTTSLQVWLDDVDRTALFTRRSSDASADLPAALALGAGAHRVRASIRDVAGNSGEGIANFTVDLANPTITVVEPAAGAYLKTTTPTIRIQYADNVGLDLTTLQVLINGNDRTSLFVKGASEAVGTLDAASALPNGGATVQAFVKDRAARSADASRSFNVDTRPPTIVITKPLAGSRHGTSDVEVIVQYHDDQKLDVATFEAKLDGLPLNLTKGDEGALGHPTGLADGSHRVTVLLRDAAGNETSTYADFTVDTGAPSIEVVQPPPGFTVDTGTPNVLIGYSDPQGVNTTTFKLSIGGTDRTSWCLAGPASATCTIPAASRLPEGKSTIYAEIRDLTNNLGSTTAEVTVDTVAPTAALVAPASTSNVNQAHPQIQVSYADSTAGVDTSSVRVFVDGVDRTAAFARGDTGATGTLAESLAEGRHDVMVTLSDHAGNDGSGAGWFVVDTVGPQASIVAPAPNGFFKDSTPAVHVTFGDGSGSGVDPAAVHVFLSIGSDPAIDITSTLTAGPGGLTGELTPALSDGTYHLSLVVSDLAANTTSVDGGFEIDTIPPSLAVASPAGYVATASPLFSLTYHDEGSGIDLPSLSLVVDGTDRTSALIKEPLQAGGTLPDPLADGVHSLTASVRDLAGNSTEVTPPPFTVDTAAPTATVVAPINGAYIGTSQPTVTVSYSDPPVGAPNPIASVIVTVDGDDRTAEFTIGPDKAEAVLATPFADETHSISAKVTDWAGNPFVTQVSHFTVDTQAPVITIVSPPEGSRHGSTPVEVTGTVTDADPQVSVSCEVVGRATVSATVSNGQFSCLVSLSEEGNAVTAKAIDRLLHSATDSRNLVLDTHAPVVSITTPAEGSYHGSSPVEVTGTFVDADSQVVVSCQVRETPVPAIVSGNGFTCLVPLVEGDNTVTVTAKDQLTHPGTASRGLKLDTHAPVVTILQPGLNDFTNAATITVSGSVVDPAPDSPIISVIVNNVPAQVSGSTFTATGVPLGDATTTITADAKDSAGNHGFGTVQVQVDRQPPIVHVTIPVAEAYLKGPTVEVHGAVTDGSSVMVEVNQQPAPVSGPPNAATFSTVVPVVDGRQLIKATAHDAAGNTGSDERWINVDSVPPTVVITEPAGGTPTRGASIHVAGTASDASPFTLRVDGQVVPVVNGQFAVDVPLPAEGPRDITVDAVDAAGNAGSAHVTVIVDRTPPALEVVSPAQGAVLGALPVAVVGTVSDATPTTVIVDSQGATRTGDAWQAAVGGLPEGPHTFTVVATDAAGNETTVTRTVLIDLTAPVVHISTPADGTVTREGTITVTGEVDDRSAVAVVVDAGGPGQPAVVTGSGPFNFTATVALADGDNTITATATDQTSRPGTASVRVTRDSIAPTIELVTPEKLSRGRPGQATVVVTDNLGLGVTFTVSVDGVSAGSFTSSPVVLPLSVPAGKVAGDSFTVSVDARDAADNPATAQRSVTVISDGVIVGQVLVDTTGLPLLGASVHMTTTSGVLAATTDERGRYSFPSGDVAAVVSVDKAGMTAVERELTIASGTGTVPVDARPTPLADPKTIVPDGGSLTAGALKVTVGAGAGGAYRLTPLSPQGLPGLLPMGWSPLAAFHLVVPADGGALSAAITGLPALATYLVEYRPTLHDWTLVSSMGTPGSVPLIFDLPGPGSFALVTADGDAVPLPAAAGDVLTGVPFQMLPATATSTSVVTPATLPPSGGIARGALHVISPSALPSGTVLQAQVTETFTLSSGEVASEEQRRQDIVLFAHPAPAEAALAAEIPITPSRTFSTTELVEGKVHLDILAGRESVRGKTGGREAVQVDSGDVRLGLAKQSLPDDTAIAVEQSSLSTFLPSSASLVSVGEAVVDFAGQRLAFAADLSLADPGVVAPGDTLLVARVERVDGVPRLVVVALAELAGGRVRTIAAEPLPGVREEGRYVFYRSAVPIGFVSGLVSPVSGRALVEMVGPGSTPFVALTTADGHYVITVAAGPVTVRAHLLKTALVGDASVTVGAGQNVSAEIALVGSVTNATVSPASGALVAPNSQLTLSVNTALDPSKITAANIQLKKTATSAAVALRFVLSGSGKTLTIVPTPPQDAPENAVALDFSTDYTLEASGLKTALGGDVLVPTVNFRTKDDTPPVYNTSALTFSFPDADGNVTVSAPAGTFPPGTQILIVNGTSGFVATFTAENDGAVGVVLPAIMPATLNDLFIVSVIDPVGNATTFNRSKFVDPATGNTAIGPGGGVVEGAGGVEMRIPDGALDKGVALKIESVAAAQFATDFPGQVPDLAGAYTGSALKITSEDKPEFKKAVDLAFPLPDFTVLPQDQRPSRPEDAFYYVYRRLVLPPVNGVERAAFETIDHAFVEGQGADRKVVTASYPLPMYQTSWGSVDASGHLTSTAGIYCVLLWSYLPLFLGKPLPGVVTGKVLRQKFNENSQNPSTSVEYEPILNALVSGVDAGGNPLFNQANATVAVTQKDGTYALFDPRYTGGPVTISAMVGGELKTATGFQANPADWATTTLRNYANIATANVTFPVVERPASPPAIQTLVMRIENGKRTDTGGLVVANTPLIIGFTAKNGDIRSATLQGNDYGIRVDPLRGQPGGMDSVLNPDFTPMEAGSYTVTATALPAFGSAVTSSYTFRVLAAGGGIDTLPNDAPSVITAQTVPKMDATGVPVTVFPQVVFTEPVRRIPGNVHLFDEEGVEVAIKISGISPSSEVIEDLTSADQTVTSLTVQPRTGLRFGTPYRLVLTAGIQDLDTNSSGNSAPKGLTPYETRFVTFGPQGLIDVGTGETFTSPGIVVLGERTYLVQNNFVNGTLRAFDTSDPVLRREIVTARATVTWRPVDIAGEEETTISEGRLVAVATSSTSQSKPSNVYLFDTTNDQATRWIGAVSLANSALDGFVNRIATKDGFLYAATAKKGIQVVDLAQAKAVFEPPGSANYWRMVQSFNSDGQGFGQEAVVQTIPVNDPSGRALMMRDLKVGDFVVDNVSQAVVAATGDAPLVVINPQSSETLARPAVEVANGSKLSWGQVIALGTIADQRVAVIVGSGITSAGSSIVLAVVDLTNPRLPLVKSVIALAGVTDAVQDVILKGNLALVGTSSRVLLVNIENLSAPVFAGTVSGVAGRLAIDQNDVLLASARSVFGGNDVLGGVRSAALGPLIAIMPVEAVMARPSDAAKLGGNEETLEDVTLDVRAYGLPDGSAQIRFYENDVPVGASTSVPLGGGRASLLIPKGRAKQEARLLRAVASASVDGGVFTSPPRLIPYVTPRLTIDSNNDTFVDDKDDLAIKTDPNSTFAFWEGAPGNGEDELVDYATVRIKLPYEMPSSWRLALQMTGAKFEVKRKLPNLTSCGDDAWDTMGKAYLCKPEPSTAQLESFNESPQPEPRGGDQYVLAEPLKPGINEFLIRCLQREDGTRACGSDQLYLLALDRRELPYASSLVASRKVDIEPFAQVVGEHTVRQSGSYDPAKFVERVPGWKAIPENAATITVLVHGFNVSEKDAKEWFLPALAKRLYWAGTPILERQGKAYLTGLLWPGDQKGNAVPISSLFYPEDEFNALRSGIPVALWLDGRADGNPNRKVNIVAHSLGNIVVNNALKERYRDPRSKITYVMLEAAVAAEAFDGAAAPLVPELVAHAQAYGYPDDQRWAAQWADMNNNQSCPPCYLSNWEQRLSAIGPNVNPPVNYAQRWSRPNPGDRTAWRNFFALNATVPNVTMFNVYSPNDYVVRTDQGRGDFTNPHPWFACQRLQKPNTGLGDATDEYVGRNADGWRDTVNVQFWASLGGPSLAEQLTANEYLFGPGNHAGLIRQWAELAFWFPALSGAAGEQPLATLGDRNFSMEAYSGSGYSLINSNSRDNSHSYFWVKKPADVWKVYEKLTNILPR